MLKVVSLGAIVFSILLHPFCYSYSFCSCACLCVFLPAVFKVCVWLSVLRFEGHKVQTLMYLGSCCCVSVYCNFAEEQVGKDLLALPLRFKVMFVKASF